MGGFLALQYVVDCQENDLAGCIGSGPLIGVGSASEAPSLQRYVVVGLSYVLPSFTISNPVKSSYLSRVPEECIKYDEDPDVHPYISFGTATDVCCH